MLRIILPILIFATCTSSFAQNISTKKDREALFEYLFERTMERESFSRIKNERLGISIEEDMLALKDEIINASTDEELFYALRKLSGTRKDRHLPVRTVEEGLKLRKRELGRAPINFLPDYSKDGKTFLFVSNYAKNIKELGASREPGIGDKLVAINGIPFKQFVKEIEPYHRYSTTENFWRWLPYYLTYRGTLYPEKYDMTKFAVMLEGKNKEKYIIKLPYVSNNKIEWQFSSAPVYKGFKLPFYR